MIYKKIKNQLIGTEGDKKVYKETIFIDNDKYGMFYVTENVNKPVILFLHGGPGSPEYVFFQSQIKSLYLDHFYTVCYMEQRGSGMLFENNKNLTVEILVSDIKKFSVYLCQKFKQEKIILMGHSWGTWLGLQATIEFPELFSCYIGISQLINVKASEKESYHYFVKALEDVGDQKMLQELSRFDVNVAQFPQQKYLKNTKTKILRKLHVGLTRIPLPNDMLVKNLFHFKGYTVSEKIKLLRGMVRSGKIFMEELRNLNIGTSELKIEIPVLIIHGKFDYQVSINISQNLFSKIEAPLKQYIVFNESAHFPHYEETELFTQKINEFIIKAKTS